MRKLMLAATAAIAALAMMAIASPAHAYVHDANTEAPCEEVFNEGNSVWGGCVVENMEGEWILEAYGYRVTDCHLSFDFHVDYFGKLYAVNQDSNGCSGFQREPCTAWATGETIPWPGTVVWVPEVGLKEKIDMCFQVPSDPGNGTWEEVTFTPVWDANDHFTDFLQYGKSENGWITHADFENKDYGEGPEILNVP